MNIGIHHFECQYFLLVTCDITFMFFDFGGESMEVWFVVDANYYVILVTQGLRATEQTEFSLI